jgi:hypothetical protein
MLNKDLEDERSVATMINQGIDCWLNKRRETVSGSFCVY